MPGTTEVILNGRNLGEQVDIDAVLLPAVRACGAAICHIDRAAGVSIRR